MKIAITGASGFIAQELISKLNTIDHIDIIKLSTSTKENDFVYTDYSIDNLIKVLEGVDTIVHLAAVRGTQGSITDYHINEIITENILIAMHYVNVKHIILASSIAVYSETKTIPWNEDMVLSPKSLYGISKASCEYLCMLYSKKFRYKYSILRIAQVLGLGEKNKGMMNLFIEQALRRQELIVYGKSIAKRQYIYIKDLVNAICNCITDSSISSDIYNIGMQNAYSNLEIAQIVNKVFNNEGNIHYIDNKSENIETSLMSVEKAKEKIAFKPLDLQMSLTDIRKGVISQCMPNI